jgi:integrase
MIRGHVRQRRWDDDEGKERASWCYVLELGRVAGARQRRTRGGFRTQKAALAAMRKEITAREGGGHVERADVSLADFVNETWLPMVEQHRRASTYDLYCRMARLHVLPTLGPTPLQDVHPGDVEKLYLWLARHGGAKGGGLGARSLHNVATTLHGALQHAVRLELLARNPAAAVSPPDARSAVDDPAHWEAEQVGGFLDHVDATLTVERTTTVHAKRRNGVEYSYTHTLAPDPMQRALWYLLATTGMRRGEACGLRWEDVDLKNGLVTVRRARVQVGGRVVESEPKTKRGRRVIRIDGSTVDALEVWNLEQRVQHNEHWEDEAGRVFTHTVLAARPARYGVPVGPGWVTAAFRELAASSDLPPLHLHGLRHSWATAALEAGENLRNVADHLGHADTSVTDRTYMATVQKVQDTTALRVARLIGSKRAAR